MHREIVLVVDKNIIWGRFSPRGRHLGYWTWCLRAPEVCSCRLAAPLWERALDHRGEPSSGQEKATVCPSCVRRRTSEAARSCRLARCNLALESPDSLGEMLDKLNPLRAEKEELIVPIISCCLWSSNWEKLLATQFV